MRSRPTLIVALLAALALASCGESGPSPEDEVREAAVAALNATDAARYCRTQVTDGYIERVFGGDERKCVSSDDVVPEEAGKVRVTKVTIDESSDSEAEVVAEVRGGSLGGAAGRVEMVKVGEDWRLDDFGDDFLRGAFLAAIRRADEGAVRLPSMKACFTRQVKTLEPATIRRLTYASSNGSDEELLQGFLEIAENCPRALAEYGTAEFTKGLIEKGQPPAYVNCLKREFTFLLELSGIVPELFGDEPDSFAVAAVEGIAEGAKKNCIGLK